MYNVSFMNTNQFIKSMLYRIDNDIDWRVVRFFAVDTVFGGVCSWTLQELASSLEDDGLTLSEFLSCYGLMELGFVFER